MVKNKQKYDKLIIKTSQDIKTQDLIVPKPFKPKLLQKLHTPYSKMVENSFFLSPC